MVVTKQNMKEKLKEFYNQPKRIQFMQFVLIWYEIVACDSVICDLVLWALGHYVIMLLWW